MSRPAFVFRGHQAPVNCVHFFADDRFLASGDQDGQVVVWNMLLKRQLVAEPDAHAGAVLAVCGVGSDTVVSQGRDNKLNIWKLGASEFSGVLNATESLDVDSMSFCKFTLAEGAETAWIAALQDAGAGKALIYNIGKGTKSALAIGRTSQTKAGGRDDSPMCLKLVPMGDQLLGLFVGYESTTLQYFEIAIGPGVCSATRKHSVKTAHEEPIMGVDYDAESKRVYTCAADNRVCCYTLDASGLHEATAPCLLKHPGSSEVRHFTSPPLVAVSGWDYALHLLDEQLNHRRDVLFHRAALTSVDISSLSQEYSQHISDPIVRQRWSSRPRWLAAASRDSRISLWNIDDI
ncbi:WD40 repeat-like protein, partial [Martensiomyces pterosporus]